MKIKVIRNTGFYERGDRLNVIIDGEKVGRIRPDERLYFPMRKITGKLQVKNFCSRSNVLEVANGDAIEVTIVPVVWRAWIVSFLFMLVGMAMANRILKISFFSIAFLIEISKFFWNEYQITTKSNRS